MAPLTPFARALTAADRSTPGGLAGPSERRFAVYRNNVAVGLIRALEIRFPALLSLVGEEFFRAMARAFLSAHPPASPLLMSFGDALPDFLSDFAPAGDMPYLADIARIEIARTRAYHAPDTPRLDIAAFADLASTDLERLHIALHPAVTVIRSPHPVWTILAMASGWQPAAPIEDWQPQAVLVDRPELDALVHPLSRETALFLEALGAGLSLGAAANGIATEGTEIDLPGVLATLIGHQLAIRIHIAEGDAP